MSDIVIDVESLRRGYENEYPIFKKLQDEAFFILDEYLANSGIKIHNIIYRVKKFESLLKKAENNKMENPLREMNDIVGLRVICLFLSDITKIAEIIRDRFAVVSEDNKIDNDDTKSFGYMSHHFTVTIRQEYNSPRYDGLHSRAFEIQIRTISMDAWSSVSHHLDYKADVDVPQELKRDFYALNGLFYVADTHFEMFFKARQKVIEKTQELVNNPRTEIQQEINFETLKAYLLKSFPDRKQTEPYHISPLVTELHNASYKTLGRLDATVSKGLRAFLRYERDYPPRGGQFASVGALRMILRLVDPNYREMSPLH